MSMEQITTLISNLGVTTAVLVYFMYRDNKFMTELQQTLTTMNQSLNTINQLLFNDKVGKGADESLLNEKKGRN